MEIPQKAAFREPDKTTTQLQGFYTLLRARARARAIEYWIAVSLRYNGYSFRQLNLWNFRTLLRVRARGFSNTGLPFGNYDWAINLTFRITHIESGDFTSVKYLLWLSC